MPVRSGARGSYGSGGGSDGELESPRRRARDDWDAPRHSRLPSGRLSPSNSATSFAEPRRSRMVAANRGAEVTRTSPARPLRRPRESATGEPGQWSLHISIHEGRRLRRIVEVQDELYPFVKVVLQAEYTRRPLEWQTSVKQGEQPRWEEETTMDLNADILDDPEASLMVELWADELKGPTKLGSREFKIAKLLDQGIERSLCALSDSTGQLRISIQPSSSSQNRGLSPQTRHAVSEDKLPETKFSDAQRSPPSGATYTGSNRNSSKVAMIFEAEAPVTFNKLGMILRKVSGKPVLSSQRQQLMAFQREVGATPRTEVTMQQFFDLCERLGIKIEEEEGMTTTSRRASATSRQRTSSPSFTRTRGIHRSNSETSMVSDVRHKSNERLRDLFDQERRVTLASVSSFLRKVTGRPVLSRQRSQIQEFGKRLGLGVRDLLSFEQIEMICQELGLVEDTSGDEVRHQNHDAPHNPRSPTPASPSFARGEAVKARFGGRSRWFNGKIRRVNSDGTYDIDYDDGDAERGVDVSLIQSLDNTHGRSSTGFDSGLDSDTGMDNFLVGDKVEAKFGGGSHWFPGVIRRVNHNGTFDIKYDDGDAEHNVSASLIRPANVSSSRLRTGPASPGVASVTSTEEEHMVGKTNARGGPQSGSLIQETFLQERRVTISNVSNVIRKITGRPVLGSQRAKIQSFARSNGIGPRDIFELEQFEDLCGALGVQDTSNASPETSTEFSGSKSSAGTSKRESLRSSRYQDNVISDAEEQSFQRGQEVEARFGGKSRWYKGTIARVHSNGSVDINYADGDQERGVEPYLVRSIGREVSSPRQLRNTGRSPPSRSARMNYENSSLQSSSSQNSRGVSKNPNSMDEERALDIFQTSSRVTASNVSLLLRKLTGRPVLASQRKQISDFVKDRQIGPRDSFTETTFLELCETLGILSCSSDAIRKEACPQGSLQEREEFRRGQKVEARFRGGSKWFKGTITRANMDDTFDIDYDDGDAEQGVRASMIRSLDSPDIRPISRSPRRTLSHAESDSESDMDAKGFRRGEKVEARFGGKSKWFTGTISRVNFNGTYDIAYDDGDSERGVRSALIRTLDRNPRSQSPRHRSTIDTDAESELDQAQSYQKGDKVEARFGGKSKWYSGTITRVHMNGTYDIAYDDGDAERGVRVSMIRAKGRVARSRSPRDRGGMDSEFDSEVEQTFRRGDKVEARFGGKLKWYSGTISRVHSNGTYDIKYDDGDAEQGVSSGMIRPSNNGIRANVPRHRAPPVDSEAESDTDAKGFRRGEKVEARFGGKSKWFTGTISRVNFNGTYDIAYDDGDSERGVRSALIRTLDRNPRSQSPRHRSTIDTDAESELDQAQSYQKGDKVEARFGGKSKWYSGTITRVHMNGTYDIAYDDGDAERGVRASMIRAKGRVARSRSPRDRGGMDSEFDSEVEQTFRRGDKVEARFGGKLKWYSGTISRVHSNGTYDIKYDDGDAEQGVRSLMIRARGGRRRSSSPRDKQRSVGESEAESEADVKGFRRGEKVQARFGGSHKYYPGTIARVHANGTYDIAYDDGDIERGVRASMIQSTNQSSRSQVRRRSRSPHRDELSVGEASQQAFKRGDRVEARFGGGSKYYLGTITQVRTNGTYDITYDDGDAEQGVHIGDIKPLDTRPRVRSRSRSRSRSPRTRTEVGSDSETDIQNTFQRGDKVEARFGGQNKWYNGVITRTYTNGTYDIAYDDGDVEKRVPVRLIRLKQTSHRAKARPKSGEEDRLRYLFDRETKGVTLGSAVELLRKLLGRALTSSERRGMMAAARNQGAGARDELSFDQLLGICDELGLLSGNREVISPSTDNDTDQDRESAFKVEDRVEAKFQGGSKFYRGKITHVNRDGTYNIDYDDGDSEKRVPPKLVRRAGSPRGGKTNSSLTSDFRTGERIEGRFGGGGNWFPGTIRRVHRDGTYDVSYDDGDSESNVSASLLRRSEREESSSGEATFVDGQRVKAYFQGGQQLYSGVICKVHSDGTCDINYDDGDRETRVKPSLIKSADRSSPRRTSPRSRSRSRSPRRNERLRSRSPRRDNSAQSRSPRDEKIFRINQHVEAKFGGGSKWYKGRITAEHRDGTYSIDYDDGDKERHISSELIRKISSPRRDASSRVKGSLSRGDKVKARFKGSEEYFIGKISNVNRDGTYAVAFDDGDFDDQVAASNIEPFDAVKTNRGRSLSTSGRDNEQVKRFKYVFDRESRVTPGTAAEVIRKTIGTPLSSDQRKDAYMFCKQKGMQTSKALTFEEYKSICIALGVLEDTDVSGSEESSESERRRSRARSRSRSRSRSPRESSKKKFQVGDRVKAQFGGGDAWYPGRIVTVHRDGTVDIDYDDGDKEQRKTPDSVRLSSPRTADRNRKSASPRKSGRKSIWSKMRRLAAREAGHGHRPPSLQDIEEEADYLARCKKILGTRRFRELQRAFNKYDHDGNGELTEDEVARTFRDMGKSFSRSDIRKWMQEVDADGSGSVTLVEFIQAYTGIMFGDESEDSSDSSSSADHHKHTTRRRGRSHSRSRSMRSKHRSRSFSYSSESSFSSGAEVTERKLWKKEAWAKQLDHDTTGAIEDAFEEYCSKTRRGRRILPAKYFRVALVSTGKEASISQVGEYMRIMGLRKHDALSLPEFAHAYVYMFCDPEKDEFGRVGSYYEKLWGSGKTGGATLGQRSTMGDTETIAALAAQIFRSGEWKGTRVQHEAFLRKLSIGRSTEDIDALKKLIRAFENIDSEESGEINTSNTESLLRSAARDPVPLRATIEAFSKTRTQTSLPEFLAAFGFVFENITGSPTVPAAFAMLRLHETPRDLRIAAETVLQLINDILARPDDANLWQIRVHDKSFYAKVGRLRGGIELMDAIGFAPQRKASGVISEEGKIQMLALRGIADKHGRAMVEGLPQDLRVMLTVRREEIEQELRVIDGGALTVGEVVRHLQDECTLAELRKVLETALSIVMDVLQNPKDSRKWRIRCANPSFMRKIGQWAHGYELMSAIGFIQDQRADVFVLRGTETGLVGTASSTKSFHFPELTKEVENMLWRRKVDLEGALKALEVTIVTGRATIIEGAPSVKGGEHSQQRELRKQIKAGAPIEQLESFDMDKFQSTMHARSATEELQLKMIRKVFESMDIDGDGYITARDLKEALRQRGHDNSDAAVADWIRARDIDNDGSVSVAEFIASFAHVVPARLKHLTRNLATETARHTQYVLKNGSGETSDEKLSDVTPVAIAFGLMRLFNTRQRCISYFTNAYAITERGLDYCTRTAPPGRQPEKPFVISVEDHRRMFGQAKGSTELLSALGWVYDKRRQTYKIRLNQDKVKEARNHLRELELHRKSMEFVEVANAKAVGAAVSVLGLTPSTLNNKPSSWLAAMETFARYLANIVDDPKAARFRRINIQNDTFRRRLGRIHGGIELFLSIGFQETEECILILPNNVDMYEIRARLVEVKAGMETLRAQSKLERQDTRIGQNLGIQSKMSDSHTTGNDKDHNKEQDPTARNMTQGSKMTQESQEHVDGDNVGGFAGRRIESLRIKELEAQVHVLREKLNTTQNISKLSAPKRLLNTAQNAYVPPESSALDEELLQASFATSYNKSRNGSTLKKGSGRGGGGLLGNSQMLPGPISRVGPPVVRTRLTRPALRGHSKLLVHSDQGFKRGDMVTIGRNREGLDTRFVVGFSDGSLILDQPLGHDQAEGYPVVRAKANSADKKGFKHREITQFIVDDILTPLIEECSNQGETLVRAREMQRRFEERPIPRPIFTSQLEHSYDLGEDAQLIAASGLHGKNILSKCGELPEVSIASRLWHSTKNASLFVLGRSNRVHFWSESMSPLELRELFELIDADGDGKISREEVVAAAGANPRVAALMSADCFRNVESSQHDSSQAFMTIFQAYKPELSWEEFASYYNAGARRAAQLRATSTWWSMVSRCREEAWAASMSDEDMREIHISFSLFDADADGRLNFQEWLAACQSMDGIRPSCKGWPDAPVRATDFSTERGAFYGSSAWSDQRLISFAEFCRLRAILARRTVSTVHNPLIASAHGGLGIINCVRSNLRRVHQGLLGEQASNLVTKSTFIQACFDDPALAELMHFPLCESNVNGPMETLETRLHRFSAQRLGTSSIVWADVAACVQIPLTADQSSTGRSNLFWGVTEQEHTIGHVDQARAYEVVCDEELQHLFILFVNGNLESWTMNATRQLACTAVLPQDSKVRHAIASGARTMSILQFDKLSSLICVCTAAIDGRFRLLDSLSLRVLRDVQLLPLNRDEALTEATIEVALYSSRWDTVFCSVSNGSTSVQVLCARYGHAIAIVSAGEMPLTPPRLLYVSEAEFLVAGDSHGQIHFWDLAEQMRWRQVYNDSSSRSLQKLLSKFRTALAFKATIDDNEELGRRAKIIAVSSTAVNVRYMDTLGGSELDVLFERLRVISPASKNLENHFQIGSEVIVLGHRTIEVIISRLYPSQVGYADVLVKSTGEAWSEIQLPPTLEKGAVGDHVEIPLPAKYVDISTLFDQLDENGDGVVSLDELRNIMLHKLQLRLHAEDVARVHDYLDVNKDGQVSLRELSGAIATHKFKTPSIMQSSKGTVRVLSARYTTSLPVKTNANPTVTSIVYLREAGLVCAAAADGILYLVDPLARRFRLTHPAYAELSPEYGAEFAQTSEAYACVHSIQVPHAAVVSQLAPVYFASVTRNMNVPFIVNLGQAEAARRTDIRLKEGLARDDHLLQGFAYVLTTGQVIVVPSEGFDERMVQLQDRALFGMAGAMTHVGGWQSGTDNLREIYRRRGEVLRVIYFVSIEARNVLEVRASLERGGLALLDLESMSRALESPHVYIYPFYQVGDGVDNVVVNPRSTSLDCVADQVGVITRRINKSVYEVAYDAQRGLLKLPRHMLEPLSDSAQSRDLRSGEQVRLHQIGDNDDVSKQHLGSHSLQHISAGMSSSPSKVIELLSALFIKPDGGMGVAVWSVDRINIMTPARDIAQYVSSEHRLEALKARSRWRAMAHQSIRAQSTLNSLQQTSLQEIETSLLIQIGAYLRESSLSAAEKLDAQGLVAKAFRLACCLPTRWGECRSLMLTSFQELFARVARGPTCSTEDLVEAIQCDLASGDEVTTLGLRYGLGSTLSDFTAKLTRGGKRTTVTLQTLLYCVDEARSKVLTSAEAFDVLAKVNFLERDAYPPDWIHNMCKKLHISYQSDETIFGFTEATFSMLTSRVDPFWSVRDAMAQAREMGQKYSAGHPCASSKLHELASLVAAHTCEKEVNNCKNSLISLSNGLKNHAIRLINDKLSASDDIVHQSEEDREVTVSNVSDWSLMKEISKVSAFYESKILSALQSKATVSYRIDSNEQSSLSFLNMPQRLVHRSRGWFRNMQSAESYVDLVVNVVSAEKLDRIQNYDGQPYEAHLEREVAMYRLFGEDNIAPIVIDNVRPAESNDVTEELKKANSRHVVLGALPGWRTLRECLDAHGYLGGEFAVHLLQLWVCQLLIILQKVHSKGVILRGPRPRQILVSPCGRFLRLASFATAGVLSMEDELRGSMLSGPDLGEVLSPEEYDYNPVEDTKEGQRPTASYDVYCLGCLLMELLSGRPPSASGKTFPYGCFELSLTTTKRQSALQGPFVLGPRGELQLCPAEGFPDATRNLERKEQSNADETRSLAELIAISNAAKFGSYFGCNATGSKTGKFSVIDLAMQFLSADPAKRITPESAFDIVCANMDEHSFHQASEAAKQWVGQICISKNITEGVRVPLDILLVQSYSRDAEPWGNGAVDPRLLLDAIDAVVECCCAPANTTADEEVGSKLPTLCDEVVGMGALQTIVKLSLRFFSSGGVADTTGRGLTNLGFVEGNSDDPIRVRIMQRVVFAFQTIASEFGKTTLTNAGSLPMANHIGALLHSMMCLYCGEENSLFPFNSSNVRNDCANHWTPELERLVSPLIRQIVTEEGGGNPRYHGIREYISKHGTWEDEEDQNRVDNQSSTAVFCRSHTYYSEVLNLGHCLSQMISTQRKSRSRFVAGRQILSLLRSTDTGHILLCIDMCVAEHVASMIGDEDDDLSQLAMECAKALLESTTKLNSFHHLGLRAHHANSQGNSILWNGQREMACAFASVSCVAMLVQHVLGENEKARNLALQILETHVKAGDTMTAAWQSCDVFPALLHVLRKSRCALAASMCASIASYGTRTLMCLFHSYPTLVSLVHDEFSIEVPNIAIVDPSGADTQLGRLLVEARDASLVKEVTQLLVRVRVAVSTDYVGARHLDDLYIELLKVVFEVWTVNFWEASLDSPALAQERIPVLCIALSLAYQMIFSENPALSPGKASKLLEESGCFSVMAKIISEDFVDLANASFEVLDFQTQAVDFLFCGFTGNDELLQAALGGLRLSSNLAELFLTYLRTNAIILHEARNNGDADRYQDILSTWPQRSTSLRQAWYSLIGACSRSSMLQDDLVRSGVIEYILVECLNDTTVLCAKSHQLRLQQTLGATWNGSMALRTDAVYLIQVLCKRLDILSALKAEFVAHVKSHGVVAREATKLTNRCPIGKDTLAMTREERQARLVLTALLSTQDCQLLEIIKNDSSVSSTLFSELTGQSSSVRGKTVWSYNEENESKSNGVYSNELKVCDNSVSALDQELHYTNVAAAATHGHAPLRSPQERLLSAAHVSSGSAWMDQLGDDIVDARTLFQAQLEGKRKFKQRQGGDNLGKVEMQNLINSLHGDASIRRAAAEALRQSHRIGQLNFEEFCLFYSKHLEFFKRNIQILSSSKVGTEGEITSVKDKLRRGTSTGSSASISRQAMGRLHDFADGTFDRFDAGGHGELTASQAQAALSSLPGMRAVLNGEVETLARSLGLAVTTLFSKQDFRLLVEALQETKGGHQRSQYDQGHERVNMESYEDLHQVVNLAEAYRSIFSSYSDTTNLLSGSNRVYAFLVECLALSGDSEKLCTRTEVEGWVTLQTGESTGSIDWIQAQHLVQLVKNSQPLMHESFIASPSQPQKGKDEAGVKKMLHAASRQPPKLLNPQRSGPQISFDEAIRNFLPKNLRQSMQTEKLRALWRAFCRYGGGRDGAIRFLSLRAAFNEMGRSHVADTELYQWIRKHDKSGSGTVRFQDFVNSYSLQHQTGKGTE